MVGLRSIRKPQIKSGHFIPNIDILPAYPSPCAFAEVTRIRC